MTITFMVTNKKHLKNKKIATSSSLGGGGTHDIFVSSGISGFGYGVVVSSDPPRDHHRRARHLLLHPHVHACSSGSRIWIKGGLNDVDLKLKLEINGNLLPIECDIMKK
jgi:hypothetical protein